MSLARRNPNIRRAEVVVAEAAVAEPNTEHCKLQAHHHSPQNMSMSTAQTPQPLKP
jgi:hypothetical protein